MPVDVPLHLCPTLKARVSYDLGDTGLSYWTQLGWTQTSKSHSRCTETRCYGNDTHTAVCHVHPSCSCPLAGPHISDIERILDDDAFAVVAIEGDGDHAKVIVESYRPELTFTLISHALGDCHANNAENKLPTCQLRSVQRAISNLSTSQVQPAQRDWFWLDTLCVPLSHLRTSTTRRNVTKSMKSISEAASQTLVLDSDISLLSSHSKPQEVFVRIAYSSWNSRLWTLQEAVFAKKLLFHFSDRGIELESLMEMYGNTFLDAETKLSCEIPFPFKELVRYLNPNRARSFSHYAFLRKAVRGRATTEKADQQLVIANLLGMDDIESSTSRELTEFLRGLETDGNTSLFSQRELPENSERIGEHGHI